MTETTVRISVLQSILALLGPRPAAASQGGESRLAYDYFRFVR